MNKLLKGFVCFWLVIAVILVSFTMLVVSVVASPIPPIAVTGFAVVIFVLSISMAIINPGIFVKQNTTAAGV